MWKATATGRRTALLVVVVLAMAALATPPGTGARPKAKASACTKLAARSTPARTLSSRRSRSGRTAVVRRSCKLAQSPSQPPADPSLTSADPPPAPAPPPPDPPNPNCVLSTPGSVIDMALDGCRQIASDTASDPSPLPFWGKIDCQNASRHQWITAGGDTHVTGGGGDQGNGSFRRLTVMDGDDVWGERCELGYNWNEANDPGTGVVGPGPTVLYGEGQRRVTYASLRLASGMDISGPNWRTVLQMKQAQPYNAPQPAPMFELNARDGSWVMFADWEELWRAPAQTGTWTRFAFDITYSQSASVGSIKAYVDLNGDGDFADASEQSPAIHRATLRRETAGLQSAVAPGGSIPSHLRAGLYQNPNYPCPAPSGCHEDIDNVQVFGP